MPNPARRCPAAGLAVMILVLAGLAGCMWQVPLADPALDARYKALSPPPGQAMLYLIREDAPEAGQVRTRVHLDGRGFGTVLGGAYLLAALGPGHHRLEVSLDNQASLDLMARPGQTYYVLHRVMASGGRFLVWLGPLSPERGRELLAASRLSLKDEFLPPLD